VRTARLVRYSGDVQGVGFRVTTARIAHGHPVTGYVRNLPDGSVELYAEGDAAAVSAFLQDVRGYWRRNIADERIQELSPAGSHLRFEIAR
jgi:acylphosphatase